MTRVFRDIAPAIVWLSLANGGVLGVTPGHPLWTHQAGWTTADAASVGDTLADGAGCPVGIESITVDPTPTAVYNLEVDGTFTYFAEGVWVHNNSCPIGWSQGSWNKFWGDTFEDFIHHTLRVPKYKGRKLSAGNTNFVPDFLCDGEIGDIKDVAELCMTPQLRAIAQYARQNGLKAVLYVGPSTKKVYDTVEKAFEVRRYFH